MTEFHFELSLKQYKHYTQAYVETLSTIACSNILEKGIQQVSIA